MQPPPKRTITSASQGLALVSEHQDFTDIEMKQLLDGIVRLDIRLHRASSSSKSAGLVFYKAVKKRRAVTEFL